MKIVILLLILTSICLAYVPREYIEPGLNYTEQKLQNGEEYSTLVTIDNIETFVVDPQGKMVEDPDQIYQLLKSNIRTASGFDTGVQNTQMVLNRIEDNRQRVENDCYRLTGMDKFDCYDKDSCVLAAFSTPVASSAVNADGFWEYMLEYRKKNIELKSDIDELNNKLKSPAEKQNADDVIELMKNITQIEYNISQNALFLTLEDENCMGFDSRDCFEYCPKLNWSHDQTDFQTEQNNWKLIANNLSKITEQDTRATNIYKETQRWKDYLQKRASIFTYTKNNISNTDSRIQSLLASEDYQQINASQIQTRYVEWALKVSDAKELGDKGQFYNAISQLLDLQDEGGSIYAAAKQNQDSLRELKTTMKDIQKTLSQTKNNSQTQKSLVELKGKYKEFENSIEYPIEPKELSQLKTKAQNLQSDALLLYAKSKLDIEIEDSQNQTKTQQPEPQPNIIQLILQILRTILQI